MRSGSTVRRARTNGFSMSRTVPNTHAATGLVRGLIYDRAGVLAASVAQEGLMRRRRDA